MEGLLWACSESKKFSLGHEKGCGEGRWVRERAGGGRSPACSPRRTATALAIDFTADCAARDSERKPQSKKGERQNRSETTSVAERWKEEARRMGGKNPSLAAALVPAQNTVENVKKKNL